MHSTTRLNRRQWLKATGAAFAGLALAPRLPLRAEPAPAADRLSDQAGPNSGTGLPTRESALTGRETRATPSPVQLALNENPFGPSPRALAAMQRELPRTHRYPSSETAALVKLIAEREGVTPDHIVIGVGSGEILETYGVYLGRQQGEVITASPGYLQLTNAMARMGSQVVAVPLNDRLEHDLDAMAAKITARTKAVYLCNPHNPTGTIVNPARLRDFAIEVSRKVPVFIDEAYLQCADDFAASTMVGLVRDGRNVTVARTFSKIYGLAGQRIGYGVMQPEMAQAIRAFSTGSVNLLGVVAAQASLEDSGYVEATRLQIKAGRDALLGLLRGLGRRYAEPQGNFVFFHTGMPCVQFRERMRAESVVVARPFAPLLEWARISIGTPEEMAVAHAALRKVLAG
jgi:histidinol-phosphate aminotransferase